MGLAAPLALLALLGVALPIVAHFVRRRDLRRQVLPTFALLQRARVQSQRRRRVADWILLAARVALVIALALALAEPFFSRQVAFGDGRAASVVIVLDDSMSMTRIDGGASLVARAKARALEIVDAIDAGADSGSEVAVVLAGTPPRTLVPMTTSLEVARGLIRDLPEASARGTDLPAALELASREVGANGRLARRVVVLSDFCAHAGAARIREREDGAERVFERLGQGASKRNRAIMSASAAADPTAAGMVSIGAEIRAFDAPDGAIEVEAISGDQKRSARAELVDGGARVTVRVPEPPRGVGVITLRILGGDAIEADDERVLLYGGTRVRTVLVASREGGGGGDPAGAGGRLVVTAIESISTPADPLVVRPVDISVLDEGSISEADAIVLVNSAAPETKASAALRRFVELGGVLIVGAGDALVGSTYERALGDLVPLRFGAEEPVAGPSGWVLAPNDLLSSADFGLARVTSTRRLSADLRAGAQVLLRFADGAPAVALGRVGKGAVLASSTSLDDAWSDLPFRPGFVPLLARTIELGRGMLHTPVGPHDAGAAVPIVLRGSTDELEVHTPDGRSLALTPRPNTRSLDFGGTDAAGLYEVRVAGSAEARETFVVVPSSADSELGPAPLPDEAQGTRSEAGHLVRSPIAQVLFLCAGLLALLEGALRLYHARNARKVGTRAQAA